MLTDEQRVHDITMLMLGQLLERDFLGMKTAIPEKNACTLVECYLAISDAVSNELKKARGSHR